jgi:hypothetical protein
LSAVQGNLLQPLPNYYSLGENIRWFAQHGVRGVFEEGPGLMQGDGSDLEELKDYVMAEMLWDPTLDPEALITEFLAVRLLSELNCGAVCPRLIDHKLCVHCVDDAGVLRKRWRPVRADVYGHDARCHE